MNHSRPGPLVFSFNGPHGVGKSSLVRRLRATFPCLRTSTEFAARLERSKRPEPATGLDLETFRHNQRLFIEWEIARFASYRPCDVVALDRGPEATEFYTLHYPSLRCAAWEPGPILSDELARLRVCRSDGILYLTASEERIRERVAADGRPRPTLERWLREFEPLARAWFGALPRCTLLDTTELTEDEVLATAIEWMNARGAGLGLAGSVGG